MTRNFNGLTGKQLEVFEQIAINNDKGHNPQTLKALVKKGFIIEEWVNLNDGGYPPVKIPIYQVPIPIHMDWCDWCSEEELTEEEKQELGI